MSTIIEAVSMSLGSGLTNAPIDNKRAVMALRAARTDAEREAIMRLVMHKRAVFRARLSDWQREWQSKPRTVTPRDVRIRRAQWGNTHDPERVAACLRESVATRERYVRCR